MRILYLLVFTFSISVFAYAQKAERQSHYPTHHLDLISERITVSHDFGALPDSSMLTNYISEAFPVELYGNIVQNAQRRSLTAHHFDFQQHVNGVRVYKTFLNLSITSKGKLMAQSQALVDLREMSVSAGDFGLKQASAYLQELKRTGTIEGSIIGLAYVPTDGALKPATVLQYFGNDQDVGTFEIVIDGSGAILYRQDLSVNLKTASDTTINIKVFDPDPITTADTVYSDTTDYRDNNDSTNAALEAEQFLRTVEAEYDNGVFSLKNRHFELVEISPPAKPFCTSTTPDFFYTRDEDCFEQVNAMYHISQMHLYIENLGFTNLSDSIIRVDVHALSGADNSQYRRAQNVLLFGEGGVDDAEDADVVIHEYAHAISDWQKPESNDDIGLAASDRQALDEAFGDYMASSYSKSLSSYMYRHIFNWDGQNASWAINRSTVSNKTYDDRSGSLYADGRIWSSAMMNLNDQIGREYMDRLLIETHAFYFAGMTMKDAAEYLLVVNEALNGTEYEPTVRQELLGRKLIEAPYDPTVVTIRNGGIIPPDGSMNFILPKRWKDATVAFSLISSHGSLISRSEAVATGFPVMYSFKEMASGVYILRIEGPDDVVVHKMIKQ